jgi:hypothetical protein
MTDAELAEVLNIPEEAVKRLDPALPFAPGGGVAGVACVASESAPLEGVSHVSLSHVSHPRCRTGRGRGIAQNARPAASRRRSHRGIAQKCAPG